MFIILIQGARIWLPDDTDVWVSGEICHDLDSSLLSVQLASGEVEFYTNSYFAETIPCPNLIT